MKAKYLFSFVVLLPLSVFLFQNCGGLESRHPSDLTTSNGSQNEENEVNEEVDNSFFKGDAYNKELIPFKLTYQEDIDEVESYLELPGYKAMAFTKNGNLYVASSTDSNLEDQADWDQTVLERCQLRFMNQPCALFASGAIIAQDRAQFLLDFKSKITVPKFFNGNLVPGSINHWQNHHSLTYPDFGVNTFKAFAIGPKGATHPGWSNDNQEEATRRAMEFCEAITDNPCTLYAEGMNIVFDLENYEWDQRRVFYAPKAFNVDAIPFIPDSVREIVRAEYGRSAHYALAMDRFGYWDSIESANPITQANRDAIITGCNAKLPAPVEGGRTRSCFVYSVDDQVVLTRQEYTMANYGY